MSEREHGITFSAASLGTVCIVANEMENMTDNLEAHYGWSFSGFGFTCCLLLFCKDEKDQKNFEASVRCGTLVYFVDIE
ncbi:hypothetical protein ILYODFUR_021611 [Ilyodon furcidens]|uniref:Uncharacterized protein n=1 Tax=Ilyodon furcidens TaxID=33524 RepID=A0ABV0TXU3_9TELE